jgi:predicted secreted protein
MRPTSSRLQVQSEAKKVPPVISLFQSKRRLPSKEFTMKKILSLLALAVMALSSCGETNKDIFQISDPAKQLEASAGNEFKIIIASNPSTGYHWELVEELDETTVQFVSREYRASEPVLAGSGGVDVWVFNAVSPGETSITLGYYPPANDPVEPQQIVEFIVTVK